jgi:hypothetical protein
MSPINAESVQLNELHAFAYFSLDVSLIEITSLPQNQHLEHYHHFCCHLH